MVSGIRRGITNPRCQSAGAPLGSGLECGLDHELAATTWLWGQPTMPLRAVCRGRGRRQQPAARGAERGGEVAAACERKGGPGEELNPSTPSKHSADAVVRGCDAGKLLAPGRLSIFSSISSRAPWSAAQSPCHGRPCKKDKELRVQYCKLQGFFFLQ